MTVAQFKPLSDEGGINHTRKTATLFDLEVYADRYSEMLETRELEYQQSLLDPTAAPSCSQDSTLRAVRAGGPGSLEDAAEATAFNSWADREAERLELEDEDDCHREQLERNALLDPTPAPDGPGSQIIKLDWPIVRGGNTPDGAA
jgi:hypothetical protein